MCEKPLVSVLMSEYNSNIDLLHESIKSILNQTYSNLEVIVIDDCGKNNVEEIIKEYKDDRIKVYKNDKNRGLAYSLNQAIKKSSGMYLARMDTDDYSYPNRIELQVDFLEKNSQYDLVASRVDWYDGKKIIGETLLYGDVNKERILNGSPIVHPSIMIRKNAIKDIGGYLEYDRCEDYATWIELFIKGKKMYVLQEKLLRYHLSLSDYKKRTLKMRMGYFKMLREEYIKLNPSVIQLVKMYLKSFLAGILPAKIMYSYHKRKNNKRHLTRS